MLDRLDELERQMRYLLSLPLIAKHIAEINAKAAEEKAAADAEALKKSRALAKAQRDARLAAAKKAAADKKPDDPNDYDAQIKSLEAEDKRIIDSEKAEDEAFTKANPVRTSPDSRIGL